MRKLRKNTEEIKEKIERKKLKGKN